MILVPPGIPCIHLLGVFDTTLLAKSTIVFSIFNIDLRNQTIILIYIVKNKFNTVYSNKINVEIDFKRSILIIVSK